MTLKLAGVVALVGAGWPILGATVTIPVRVNESHRIFIEARINGSEPMWCNLDSGGGDRLYLDRERGARLGIQVVGGGLSAGPHDAKMSLDQRARVSLEVSGVKLADQNLVLQSRPYEEYACVIGQTIFRQYVVEVDYRASVVRLHDAKGYRYDGLGKAVAVTLEGGSPFVETVLTTPGGKEFAAKLAVDTGCGSGLAMLSKSYVEKSGLLSEGPALVDDRRFGSVEGQAKVVTARFAKFRVGAFDMDQPVLHLWQVNGFGGAAGPDGLLCGEFLMRYKLIFDYGGQRIILEPVN